MANDKNGDRAEQPNEEAALSARLQRLGKRLGEVKADRQSDSDTTRRTRVDASAMARGFRLSTELVAGVLVGAAIGWLLDKWLGTLPWGMIVFLLLGFAAGILNVMRSAGVVAPNRIDPPDAR